MTLNRIKCCSVFFTDGSKAVFNHPCNCPIAIIEDYIRKTYQAELYGYLEFENATFNIERSKPYRMYSTFTKTGSGTNDFTANCTTDGVTVEYLRLRRELYGTSVCVKDAAGNTDEQGGVYLKTTSRSCLSSGVSDPLVTDPSDIITPCALSGAIDDMPSSLTVVHKYNTGLPELILTS